MFSALPFTSWVNAKHGNKMSNEKPIEDKIIQLLKQDPYSLKFQSTSNIEYQNIGRLINGSPFDILQDTSDWNQHKNICIDISGQMTPDIVIRSKVTNQNRIIIEVKDWARISNNGRQLRSYFIHLLVTTTRDASVSGGIVRAIILAAPDHWFRDRNRYAAYDIFLQECAGLANDYGIVLAAINMADISL